MKKSILIISLAMIAGPVLEFRSLAGEETNSTYLEVLNASNSVAAVIQTVPDVEKLWPQDPSAYLKSASQVARVLDGSLNNSNAEKVFLNLFSGIMQKSCPTNEEQAAFWVRLKTETIYFYVVHDDIGRNKSNWLAVAKFLGEIRSKRIPNYVNQGAMLSLMNLGRGGQAEMQKAVEENERKKVTDTFQSELWQADSTLMFLIQHACPFTQPDGPFDTNLIDQIVSAGHLTTGESKELKRK